MTILSQQNLENMETWRVPLVKLVKSVVILYALLPEKDYWTFIVDMINQNPWKNEWVGILEPNTNFKHWDDFSY